MRPTTSTAFARSLSHHDDGDALALPNIERLRRTKHAVLVQGFNGSHWHDAKTNCSSSSPLQISNRDQIALCNRTNVALSERHESLRPSGRENELNVETIRRVNIDHCAEVSLSQPVFRQITIENDCVE